MKKRQRNRDVNPFKNGIVVYEVFVQTSGCLIETKKIQLVLSDPNVYCTGTLANEQEETD